MDLFNHIPYIGGRGKTLFGQIGTSSQSSSWSPFRQLTGTTIVERYFHYSFLHHFSSLSQPFLIEGVLGSINLFSERWRERPKIFGCIPFQTPLAIFGRPCGHFELLGFLVREPELNIWLCLCGVWCVMCDVCVVSPGWMRCSDRSTRQLYSHSQYVQLYSTCVHTTWAQRGNK